MMKLGFALWLFLLHLLLHYYKQKHVKLILNSEYKIKKVI
jgi:hypothetical protein